MLTSITWKQRIITCNDDITTKINQETLWLLFSDGSKQRMWLIAQINENEGSETDINE